MVPHLLCHAWHRRPVATFSPTPLSRRSCRPTPNRSPATPLRRSPLRDATPRPASRGPYSRNSRSPTLRIRPTSARTRSPVPATTDPSTRFGATTGAVPDPSPGSTSPTAASCARCGRSPWRRSASARTTKPPGVPSSCVIRPRPPTRSWPATEALWGAQRRGRDPGPQLLVPAGDRQLSELVDDVLRRVEQDAGVGGQEHGGVVVRVARGDDAERHALQRPHRGTLLVGHAQPVPGDPPVVGDLQRMAEQRGESQLPHQRMGELGERVGEEDHAAESLAQPVEELDRSGQGRHRRDDRLNVGELETVPVEDRQPVAHEHVVVRLVAGGPPQLGDPGALGDGDPDLGNQYAFEVEAHQFRPHVCLAHRPSTRISRIRPDTAEVIVRNSETVSVNSASRAMWVMIPRRAWPSSSVVWRTARIETSCLAKTDATLASTPGSSLTCIVR